MASESVAHQPCQPYLKERGEEFMTITELNDDNLSELADNAARKAGHEKCLLFEGCNDGSMECGDCPYNFDGEY